MSRLRGNNQAIRNANDGISIIDVADEALQETESALTRLRRVVMLVERGGFAPAEQLSLQTEVDQLVARIDQAAQRVKWHESQLLRGGANSAGASLDLGSGRVVSFSWDKLGAQGLGLGEEPAAAVSAQAQPDVERVESALADVGDLRMDLGLARNRLEQVIDDLQDASARALEERQARRLDGAQAASVANLTRDAIERYAQGAIDAQANQHPMLARLLAAAPLDAFGER
ncbi:putative flagellin domain-containing protein [Magnetofaba australis IT-1]|uniref:Putative flagellin domain-containing protein n=2 Tax=Magnetofaba TaxID=1472292 RepID=A0A1Y2K6E9_9PROT|nr:putative flagellin domain-containing protein [Magnetofaba australis IT-1]